MIPVLSQHLPLYRSRLVLSESLAAQSPRSPFRRAPSTLRRGASRGVLTRGGSRDQDIEGLLNVARSDIQRLRQQESTKVWAVLV